MNEPRGFVKQQNPDGSWTEATPVPMQGWKANLESFFWKIGFKRGASFMAMWTSEGSAANRFLAAWGTRREVRNATPRLTHHQSSTRGECILYTMSRKHIHEKKELSTADGCSHLGCRRSCTITSGSTIIRSHQRVQYMYSPQR